MNEIRIRRRAFRQWIGRNEATSVPSVVPPPVVVEGGLGVEELAWKAEGLRDLALFLEHDAVWAHGASPSHFDASVASDIVQHQRRSKAVRRVNVGQGTKTAWLGEVVRRPACLARSSVGRLFGSRKRRCIARNSACIRTGRRTSCNYGSFAIFAPADWSSTTTDHAAHSLVRGGKKTICGTKSSPHLGGTN